MVQLLFRASAQSLHSGPLSQYFIDAPRATKWVLDIRTSRVGDLLAKWCWFYHFRGFFRKRRGQKLRAPSGRHLLGNWASQMKPFWAIFRHKRSITTPNAPLQLDNEPPTTSPHQPLTKQTHKTNWLSACSRFSCILGHAAEDLAPPTQMVKCGYNSKYSISRGPQACYMNSSGDWSCHAQLPGGQTGSGSRWRLNSVGFSWFCDLSPRSMQLR